MDGPRAATSKILCLFGTRPEAIKLAPVIRELQARSMRVVTVNTGQHRDLLDPLLTLLDIPDNYDLKVMRPEQSLSQLSGNILSHLDPIFSRESPDFVLVQGDTSSALIGALTAFHHKTALGHVEAGLRSGNRKSPFPEEMNRRLITQLADYHFAATPSNRETLISEGVAEQNIFVTGNPVVDSLRHIQREKPMSVRLKQLLDDSAHSKRLVLTTHRRENFGDTMLSHLHILKDFVIQNQDITLIFPVHPNPAVHRAANAIFSGHKRILLIEPLTYPDFIGLLSHSWLIVSDSGGIQEEAPSLGKPLLILRENTERPESVESGIAQLVGHHPEQLGRLLEEAYRQFPHSTQTSLAKNPFGQGNAAKLIVDQLEILFDQQHTASRQSFGVHNI